MKSCMLEGRKGDKKYTFRKSFSWSSRSIYRENKLICSPRLWLILHFLERVFEPLKDVAVTRISFLMYDNH